LLSAGLPVPEGFHITTRAYNIFVEENHLHTTIDEALGQVDIEKPSTLESASEAIRSVFLAAPIPDDIARDIVGAYGDIAGENPPVAVRSSATAEDLPEASFAGQQESFLNVSGADHLLEATKKCWSSLWTARAIGYRTRRGFSADGVALAVVVQKLVPAEAAGVLFTTNPVSGDRDQVQISAAWGLGDAVVGGRVTPDDYIVEKGRLRVIKREVAEKEVMTVRVNGGTEDQPVPGNLSEVPVLGDEDLLELTRLGLEIERLFEMPMDIEWAMADGKVAILQARPITSLPEGFVPPPEEWELPDPKGRYMRASIVDMMPDPLSPLFATMGVAIYNDRIRQMMVDVTDSPSAAFPGDIIVPLYDYAYMRVNFSAREWWAMIAKLAPKIPGLIRQGPDHFREDALPAYREKVDRLSQTPVVEHSATQIWEDAHALTAAAMDHLSILQVDTLGAAAGSEGLFTAIYSRFFQRENDPHPSAFLMGYDTTPIRSEMSLYDLAQWAADQPALSRYILETDAGKITQAVSSEMVPEGIPPEVWTVWQRRIEDHLDTFGHLLYDLDFAKPVPAEDPTPALETVKMYLRGEGANPHERQKRLASQREQATKELLERARGLRGWAVRKALGWAQSVGEVREDGIASIGLAYPRLRALLKEIGRRMVQQGAIDVPTDIFWLDESEIEVRLDALEKHERPESLRERVAGRKKVREAERKVMPPTQLPPSKTYMGIPIEVFMPGEGGQEGSRLRGVGASGGKVTGLAYVLQGPEDFDQMVQGGILVAKMTTPAWTPLFAMAGAVVTDIGGPLSHGSIVAREYGIPAVLGTVAATRVIQSGQEITVDGDAGYVTISSND
jgi:pyruvate,water dikinase